MAYASRNLPCKSFLVLLLSLTCLVQAATLSDIPNGPSTAKDQGRRRAHSQRPGPLRHTHSHLSEDLLEQISRRKLTTFDTPHLEKPSQQFPMRTSLTEVNAGSEGSSGQAAINVNAQPEQLPAKTSRTKTPISAKPEYYVEETSKRKLQALYTPQAMILPYHNGPILSGKDGTTNVYVVFYGNFTKGQRGVLRRFLKSFSPQQHRPRASIPTVGRWWEITKGYQDVYGETVAQDMKLSGEIQDREYSLGHKLNKTDVEKLVMNSLSSFVTSARSLYLVLTSSDVEVSEFCQESCGQHSYTYPSAETGGQMLPYVWVGDASMQCPGLCCWPFANPEYSFMGPSQEPLLPPNQDIGLDGMIINLASLIAGAATDPYANGYYLGDSSAPLEAAEACKGIYGESAFAGYPGDLMTDNKTGGSYNMLGFHRHQFLLPWMWNPNMFACAGQA